MTTGMKESGTSLDFRVREDKTMRLYMPTVFRLPPETQLQQPPCILIPVPPIEIPQFAKGCALLRPTVGSSSVDRLDSYPDLWWFSSCGTPSSA